MLAKRIIPCLDVNQGRVVKGVTFLNLRDAGDPLEQARAYAGEGADELAFLDITASYEGRGTLLEMVEQVAETLFIPFTVGGGVRTVDDFRALLRAGADKATVNTAAVQNPELVDECAAQFGSQCVVVAMDVRRAAGGEATGAPRWEVVTHGGRTPTGKDAVEWAKEVARRGAGELLLTSMDRDGTRRGYDTQLLRAIADAVPIPLIASGGAGELEHFYDALTAGRADAVLAATLFHDRLLTLGQVKEYLAGRGLPIRPARP